eukprot:220092-Rhodomonas_salina.2
MKVDDEGHEGRRRGDTCCCWTVLLHPIVIHTFRATLLPHIWPAETRQVSLECDDQDEDTHRFLRLRQQLPRLACPA